MSLWMCEACESGEKKGTTGWRKVTEAADNGTATTTAATAAAAAATDAARIRLGIPPITAAERVERSSTAACAAILLRRDSTAEPTIVTTASSAAWSGHYRFKTANDTECAWGSI